MIAMYGEVLARMNSQNTEYRICLILLSYKVWSDLYPDYSHACKFGRQQPFSTFFNVFRFRITQSSLSLYVYVKIQPLHVLLFPLGFVWACKIISRHLQTETSTEGLFSLNGRTNLLLRRKHMQNIVQIFNDFIKIIHSKDEQVEGPYP